MITLRSDGTRKLRRNEKRLIKWLAAIRRFFSVQVQLDERGHRSRFWCETPVDAFRPLSLWIKEPGTMAWIDRDVKVGDRFLDIGANIGIYTIAAAQRVGAGGRVYAVEPHKVNSISLMRNVVLNRLQDRVVMMPVALSDTSGFANFNYLSLDSASTGSQLGQTLHASTGREFTPIASETLVVTTVDDLIARGAMEPPDLVKIDVDGIEMAILRGMQQTFASTRKPRAVQVELNPGEQEQITALMQSYGYRLEARHHTLHGQKASDAGHALNDVAHNALFVPI